VTKLGISVLYFFRITKETEDILKATSKHNLEKEGVIPTQLCCRTLEAQKINDYQLQQLKGMCTVI
jgi:hypothetical protein